LVTFFASFLFYLPTYLSCLLSFFLPSFLYFFQNVMPHPASRDCFSTCLWCTYYEDGELEKERSSVEEAREWMQQFGC
jgi:hypothetical protein